MKKTLLTMLIAFGSISIHCISDQNAPAKSFLNRNAIGIATILGGIAEVKDIPPKAKTVCNTLALVFLVYRSAEKLPQHHRNYRSRNNFSLVEGLYSLSAAAFISASIAKSIKEMRKPNPIPAN